MELEKKHVKQLAVVSLILFFGNAYLLVTMPECVECTITCETVGYEQLQAFMETPPPTIVLEPLEDVVPKIKCPTYPVQECPKCMDCNPCKPEIKSTTTINTPACTLKNGKEMLNNRPGSGKPPCYQTGWFDCKKEYLELIGLKKNTFSERPSNNVYQLLVGEDFENNLVCFPDMSDGEKTKFSLDNTIWMIKNENSSKIIYKK